MSRPRENTKSLYAISDTPTVGGDQGGNALQRQAGQMFTDPCCNEAFAGRISPARGGGQENTDLEIKKASFGGADALRDMNPDGDQAAVALKENGNADNLEVMIDRDPDAAARIVVADSTLHTTGLNTENVAFNQKIREQLTGFGTA